MPYSPGYGEELRNLCGEIPGLSLLLVKIDQAILGQGVQGGGVSARAGFGTSRWEGRDLHVVLGATYRVPLAALFHVRVLYEQYGWNINFRDGLRDSVSYVEAVLTPGEE